MLSYGILRNQKPYTTCSMISSGLTLRMQSCQLLLDFDFSYHGMADPMDSFAISFNGEFVT